MPRKKPIPAARRQFSQWQGMPIQARMQRNPGQMARQARTQARNPMAGRAKARPMARNARRQMSLARELSSMRERASTRPAGLKAEWRQSFWFQIPIIGGLVDLLRNLFYPQENLRVMKRAFVGTGIGSIAKNRARARFEQRRQEKLASRRRVLVQRNRAPGIAGTIARQRQTKGRTQGVPKYRERKAA